MLDDFVIRPDTASFDVAELTTAVRRADYVVVLPPDTSAFARPKRCESYLVCGSPEQATRVKRHIESGGRVDEYVGSVAFLEITPKYISVYQPAPREVLDHVRSFLLSFLKKHAHRVFVETGEVTADYLPPDLLF
jgi:hypothetical protein